MTEAQALTGGPSNNHKAIPPYTLGHLIHRPFGFATLSHLPKISGFEGSHLPLFNPTLSPIGGDFEVYYTHGKPSCKH